MVITCDSLPVLNWAKAFQAPVEKEVAIFKIQVSENIKYAQHLYPLLQADEVARASKYHRAEDQYRFLIARAALRILLGKYIGHRPAEINFELGANKKPVLKDTPGLHYNTAHSKDWILLAIAGVEVGVDVEQVDARFPFENVLTHSFSLPEQAFIAQSATSRLAFFRAWTRKEALVKATAQGIDADFGNVPALDGRHYVAGREPAAWAVSSFEAAADYVAAIARPAAVPHGNLRFYEVGADLFASAYAI